MKGIKRVVTGVGKVMLALLTGLLMPILIWVTLGVALTRKLHEGKIQRTPAPTIDEILTKAGLTIH